MPGEPCSGSTTTQGSAWRTSCDWVSANGMKRSEARTPAACRSAIARPSASAASSCGVAPGALPAGSETIARGTRTSNEAGSVSVQASDTCASGPDGNSE